MKQKLRVFLTLLLCAVASVGWGEEITYTFQSKSWTAVLGNSTTPANWTSGKEGSGFIGSQGVQVTTSTSGANATSPDSYANISKIVVVYNTNKTSGKGAIKIQVGDNAEISNNVAYSGSGDGRSANYITEFDNINQSGYVKLTVTCSTNSIYVHQIIITYNEGGSTETVATPTFSPAAGTYTSAQNVTLSCATSGASIYYTIDGATPSNESAPYNGAINVASTTTIKAIAYVGEDASNIAVATYTILTPTTIADARSAENNETVCTNGTVTSVSGATAYIQDATSAIVLHNGNTNTLNVGDKVTVYGTKTVFNGLVEITNAQNTVLSQNNEVTPALKTIEEINSDYAGANALQAMLVKIEDATVTAVSGDYTTISQGENSITIFKMNYEGEVEVNDKITLTANIGCYNGVQLVNAKDITVTKTIQPAIVVEPATVELEQYEAEGTIEVTYQNVETELAELQICDAEGNAATYDWITAELNNDKNIEYLVEANTGAARTAYMKVYSLDAEGNDVYSELITITQDAYAVDYAVLPFEWEGGSSSDFTALAGVTTDGLGSDYAAGNAPYLIKLDNTGDYIMVKTDSRPGKVTINVKMLGGANTSSITIQGSSDGSEFSDVEELEIAGTQNSELTLETSNDFAENDCFVKLVFTKGSNVGIGAITIAKYTTSASITVAETEVSLTATESEGTIGVAYKNLADVPEVAFFAADGTTAAEYDWLVAEINGNNISYMVEANEGEARTAYMKVYGLDAEANDIYSELITITQAGQQSQQNYTVSLGDLSHVTIALWDEDLNDIDAGSEVAAGTVVYVSPTVEDGYTLETLKVLNDDNEEITLTENSGAWSFTMPESNVTITATATEVPVEGNVATLTNANILEAGDGDTGYKEYSITDDNNKIWNAYAIKNQHSKATSGYHYLQIKKYASNTAYYIQVPEYGTKILKLEMTVSGSNQPMDGGSNNATLFFSADNTTSAAGEGVVSGTGANKVVINCSDLNLNTGYITAGGAVRIWDVKVTYEEAASETVTVSVNDKATDGNKFYSTLYYGEKNLKIPAGVTASGVSVNGKSLVMGPVLAKDNVIAKGNAVLLTADAAGNYEFTVVADTEVDATISWDANLLRGNDGEATTEGGDVYYQLSRNANRDANSIGFYWGAADGGPFNNKAHRAYLAVTTEQAGGAKGFAFNDMATGIKSIAADTENGNAIIYNLAGQRVSNAQKGIYIVNGKKVVIR